jgi:crotonobetainyl-CoA:carnitine CoA-transferase CaiB-like acyl-CoA transferase
VVRPLAGIRVIDLTRFVSGAYATMVLDSLGADVVKVEALPEGDPYRSQGAVQVGEQSALFASLNAGKRSIAVDIGQADGVDLVRRLVTTADVFVENGRPGSLDRLGLGYETLSGLNPRLVYASISGFGQSGPDAARGGFDLILQAASGLMSVTGTQESGPVKVGAPVLDIGSGLSCVTAILAALLSRTVDGNGRWVSSSLLEFAMSCFTSYSSGVLATGESPGLLGSHSPQFAPYGVFRCRDGAIALAGTGSDELWTRLCGALGHEEWTRDPRFAANANRVVHRDELTAQIEDVLAESGVTHWLSLLDAATIPASEVRSAGSVLTSAQAQALGSVQQLTTPQGHPYGTVRPPVNLDTDVSYSRGAPALGGHTTEVLRQLGHSAAEIDELLRRQIVAAA